MTDRSHRPRLRDLGFTIGRLPTGPLNSITDVAGIGVGHRTVVRDTPRVARTGVTVITTRPSGEESDLCCAAIHSFNGNGEMTGSHWLAESGLLSGPVAITNTHQVGVVRDALVEHEVRQGHDFSWCLPVVAETYDGFLNDIEAFHVTADDVFAALADVSTGKVAEGNVGGGTGMICHEFKGGIGTSSRVVETGGAGVYTLGVLVQANYGAREDLRLDGLHVGAAIGVDVVPAPTDPAVADAGSIIVVIATDAPLVADQCKRLAQRATVGLARTGGYGSNGSGDIFLALSTGNRVPVTGSEPIEMRAMPIEHISPLFRAAAEAVEEAIWNALCAAETMTGFRDRVVHAIPLDQLIAMR